MRFTRREFQRQEKTDEKKEEIKEEEKKEEKTEEKKEENKEETEGDKKEEKPEEQIPRETKDKPKEKEKDKDKTSKKKKKKPKNYDKEVVIKDFSEFTFFQKIRVVFINSLNNPVVFFLRININTTIKEIASQFASLYHYKFDYYSKDIPLHFFINGKKHSVANTTSKYFIPTKFDYKSDYILLLEKQISKLKEYDLGSRCNYVNFRGAEIPHVVYNSLFNFEIDCFIAIKGLSSLDCQIYELKKDIDLRQFTDNEHTIKKKLREFLDLNWKERSNFITTFKSVKAKKSKDNYNGNLYEINRKFVLLQGKMYIFLIKSNNKKVDAFIGRHISTEGIFIVTKNDKAILNGFRGKPISDFTAYS